jgi:hypothetical protein
MIDKRIIHQSLASSGRWFTFSLIGQLANVGTDVARAIRWKNEGELHDSALAVERALELMDFTVADPKNKKRLKELLRVRAMLADYFIGINEFSFTDEFWQEYFYDFNYAAAIARGK